MAEYIEREFVCGDCIHADVCEEAETLVGFSRDNIAYCGMFLNAADVPPVRHGRWEWLGRRAVEYGYEKHLRCSVCGRTKWYYDANDCPNCGAKMDLGGGGGDA